MTMFCEMINVALVNEYVVYAHNMSKQQPHMKLKRKEFLHSIARHLVTAFVTQIYNVPRRQQKSKKL